MISTIIPLLSSQWEHHPIRSLIILVVLVPVSYLIFNEYVRYSRRIKGFPGPPNWPVVGNIPDIKYNAAQKYMEWSKKYGGVYQVQLGNEPVIVVNTADSARKLFGGHSQALSSRPVLWTFHKVLSNTAGTTIGTSPYNDSLKRRRKGAASALNKPSIATYIYHLDLETKDFVKDGFESGKAGTVGVDPMPMIERLSLSLALTLNWGTRMGSRHDPLFHEICEVEAAVSKFRSTTGNLQDYIPILRLNPFSHGTKQAKDYRNRRDVYLAKLNRDLDERMAKGIHKPCIQANIIEDKEAALNKEELTSISLTMLSGGLDTITTLVQWSIALLAQKPEMQDKAIKEIRKFYSEEEPLADAYDDQQCSYIVALVRECLRYYTVLRLALPRSTVRDITYEGKVIPAGSTLYLNAWACNMDPDVWSDPEEFRPERWLEQPNAPLHTYGLGYRMCAGSLLANRELYLIFLRLLNSFELVQDSQVDVHPVRGSSDPTSLVTMCHAYKVIFKPRNERALREALKAADERLAGKEKADASGHGNAERSLNEKFPWMVATGGTTNSRWLQEGAIRGNMFAKALLPGDEELGKKDDDHKYRPVRRSGWAIWNHAFRWRRRRTLLALAGLFVVYYYLFNGVSHEYGEVFEGNSRYPLGRPISTVYEKPQTYNNPDDDDEPTGPPPGMHHPKHGESPPRVYGGDVRFYRLATSLRATSSSSEGYENINRNILFAMSSLKSVATLLPMVCEMSQWNRNFVHVAFMGREDIPVKDLIQINGIDREKCQVVWHDARPDYTEYSSDARAESAVIGAMTHIQRYLHPQVAIIDDPSSEDDFFTNGMRSKTGKMGVPLIEVPRDRVEDLMWLTRLDVGSLKHWHDASVDVLIQVPSHSSSVLRLLNSIKEADYSGLKPPRITLELPAELDVSLKEHLEKFEWHHSGGLILRRRILSHGHNQEESAIRFLELFYPSSTSNSHVLLLSPQAQLSRQYFHFIQYALLEYKYSFFGDSDNAGLMGISLELPSVLLDGKTKLNLPSTGDMHTTGYEKRYPKMRSSPFMWQAPSSHATLFLGDKWTELHSFLRHRVAKHHKTKKSALRKKLVSETLPAWSEYMLEMMRARGYTILYPAKHSRPFVTIHNELYYGPEEFTTSPTVDDQESPSEVFLRAKGQVEPPKYTETDVVPGSVPLHLALPFDGDLPEIPHLPHLLYDGQQIDLVNVSTIAKTYADTFREEIGGCQIPKGKHKKKIAAEAGDLFCYGDEDASDWEDDETREVELFDAPIDDELEKVIENALPSAATSTSTKQSAITRPTAKVGDL
ncbi:hypothetical protein PTNB73_06153 [Pyrenophora teres f. teres]|nr:hypothetical protein PTNB85_07905 [Pyrenophora teres f. teres]KAE8829878.1 hypothetical protein HRS9139_06502 [Pyrenophora teres f. teres]KAE8841782.1 hypothetical protein HRS9122_05908 [Pyrenophora teres f. teres]KAE8865265.1 hypothetical protein PTNB73_06153 [Pyrenophora teres f. teres]